MMKWIDQTLFDDLILTNSDQAERTIRDIQPLMEEVLPVIADATLQLRVYHDETDLTNYLDSVRICFVRNMILFSVSKQTYPKNTYRILCCNDDDLQYTDNYSRMKAHEGLVEPQRIGKLSKRKVEEWVEYQTQYYRNLVCIDKENDRSIREHIARLERIPDVLWSGTGNPERSNAMVSVIRSRSSARVFPKTSGCRAPVIRSMRFWRWRAPMNRSCPTNPKRQISFPEKAIHETIRSKGPIYFRRTLCCTGGIRDGCCPYGFSSMRADARRGYPYGPWRYSMPGLGVSHSSRYADFIHKRQK